MTLYLKEADVLLGPASRWLENVLIVTSSMTFVTELRFILIPRKLTSGVFEKGTNYNVKANNIYIYTTKW